MVSGDYILSGIIFALMKFYHVSQLEDSMKELKQAVDRLNNHEVRISRLEEQNKTLFRGIGGNKMIDWKSRIKINNSGCLLFLQFCYLFK